MTIQLDREIEAKYEVLAIMGEGGMGAVYKVRHRYLDDIQIIKLMRHQLQTDENLKARFLREAKTAKKLRHPNIAEVIDYDVTSEGTAFIVMEFIEGINLRELQARSGGKFDPRFVVDAGIQSLSALAYLHGKGFVHRDISPDNLMVTRIEGRDVVKLIDLGIAKSIEATSNLTMDGKFVGKIQYASPEQFGGEIDHRSDIYSLGVALYEMLTGAQPIGGSDYRSIIAGVLTRPPRSFDETDPGGLIPGSLREAILKALQKDPDNRYPTAEAFAAALESARAHLPLRVDQQAISTQVLPARGSDDKTQVWADDAAATAPITDPSRAATRITDESTPPGGALIPTAVTNSASIGGAETIVPAAGMATRPSRRRVMLSAIAVALVIVVTVIGWQFWPERVPISDPVPAQTGELIIKGLPWGEVVEVIDSEGRNRIPVKPLYTPAALTLPPGSYRVLVSNPVSKRSVPLNAIVTPLKSASYEAKLDEIDAASYLKEVMP